MDVINPILNTRKLRLREGKFVVQDAPVWGLCGTRGAEETQGVLGGGGGWRISQGWASWRGWVWETVSVRRWAPSFPAAGQGETEGHCGDESFVTHFYLAH